jgi:hypothetical protein
MSTKTASLIFGFAFLAVGILGYFPNPIISSSDDAVFHTDSVHNIVHIVSGILFFVFALAAPANAGTFLKVFGAVYLLLGIAGLLTIGDNEHIRLLGFLLVNNADNFLHIGLGAAILLAGFLPAINATVDRRTA